MAEDEKDFFDGRAPLVIAISLLVIVIGVGTFFYTRLENWTLIEAFYFSVTTLTTVGYGDLTPTNDMSRLFTALFCLAGVAIVLSSLSILGSQYLKHQEERFLKTIQKRKMKKKGWFLFK